MAPRFVLSVAALIASQAAAASQPPPPPPPGSGSSAVSRPAAPAELPAKPAPDGPIAVPEGNGAPVITDGQFSPGEWEDARRIAVGNAVTLYVKRWRDVVFIGVRGEGGAGIGPSELGLAAPGGPVLKLHVSAQLFENVLRPTGDEPQPRMGLTTGWYANELRRDEAMLARMQKEGRPPIETMRAASYPSDGIEFAIRRSKLAGERWLLRLWASAMDGDRPGMLTWPAGTTERHTAGWSELSLR
jgi:hypothetical protein